MPPILWQFFYCHCSPWFLITFGNTTAPQMSKSGWPVSNSNLPTAITWCGAATPSPSWRCLWKRTTVTFELASEGLACWWLPPLLSAGRARCVCVRTHQCAAAHPRRNVSSASALNGWKKWGDVKRKVGKRVSGKFPALRKDVINVEEVCKLCHYFGAMHRQNAAAAFAAHSVLDVCFQGATSRQHSTESSHLYIKSKLCGWMVFFFLSHKSQNK